MKKLTKLICLILVAAFPILLFPGCNTVRGVGQDIESGGKAVKRAADKAER